MRASVRVRVNLPRAPQRIVAIGVRIRDRVRYRVRVRVKVRLRVGFRVRVNLTKKCKGVGFFTCDMILRLGLR